MWHFFTDIAWKKKLRKFGIKLVPRVSQLRARLHLEEGVSISDVSIGAGVLHVGALTYLRSGCVIGNRVSLGRFCSVGNGGVLGMERTTHPLDWVSTHPFQFTGTELSYQARILATDIGNDVWIGKDAIIMEGVNVGTGSVIGTRAVVTRDVPPYAIVAGIPAKIVHYRHSPEIIERLLETRWWDLAPSFLKQAPLDNPAAFIEFIRTSRPPAFRYASIEVANNQTSSAEQPSG